MAAVTRGATQDWFVQIIMVRPVSPGQGRLPWPLAWQPAPRPRKQTLNHRELQAQVGAGWGWGEAHKNSFYESVLPNQQME